MTNKYTHKNSHMRKQIHKSLPICNKTQGQIVLKVKFALMVKSQKLFDTFLCAMNIPVLNECMFTVISAIKW